MLQRQGNMWKKRNTETWRHPSITDAIENCDQRHSLILKYTEHIQNTECLIFQTTIGLIRRSRLLSWSRAGDVRASCTDLLPIDQEMSQSIQLFHRIDFQMSQWITRHQLIIPIFISSARFNKTLNPTIQAVSRARNPGPSFVFSVTIRPVRLFGDTYNFVAEWHTIKLVFWLILSFSHRLFFSLRQFVCVWKHSLYSFPSYQSKHCLRINRNIEINMWVYLKGYGEVQRRFAKVSSTPRTRPLSSCWSSRACPARSASGTIRMARRTKWEGPLNSICAVCQHLCTIFG